MKTPHPHDIEVLMEHAISLLLTPSMLAPVVEECWRSSIDEQMLSGEMDTVPFTPQEINDAGIEAQIYYLAMQLGVPDTFGKMNELLA